MTSRTLAFLAVLSGGVCSATEGGFYTSLPPIPEVRMPAPELRGRPASVRMPTPAPMKGPVFRVVMNMNCGWGLPYEEPSPLGLIDLFGSVDDFRHALSAATIEVVELKPETDFVAASDEYAERVVTLPASEAASVKAVLTADASFNWLDAPEVFSRPDVRVKFRGNARVVAIDLFLASRSVRSCESTRYWGPVSIGSGFETLRAIVERHFPGISR